MELDRGALHHILDELVEPVICAGEDGNLLLANRAAAELLGAGVLPGISVPRLLQDRPEVAVAHTARLTALPGAVVHTLASRAVRDTALVRLQALAELSRIFSSRIPLEDALQRTAELAAHAVGEWAMIHRVLPGGEEIEVAAVHHRDRRLEADVQAIAQLPGARRRVGSAPGAARVAQTGEPELYTTVTPEELAHFAGSPERLAAIQRVGCASMAVVPLRTPSGILGTLLVGSGPATQPVIQDDVAFVQQLADRVASALGREELLGQLERERARLALALAEREEGERRTQALAEVSRLLLDAAGGPPEEPLRRAVDRIGQAFGLPCLFLLARGEAGFEPVAASAEAAALAGSLGGRPIALEALTARLLDEPERARLGLSTGIVAPLSPREGPRGLLLVGGTVPWRPFSVADVEFAAALADRASLALSHAVLTQAVARERDEARAAKASLEALVRHAPVGVAFLDRELRFVLANEMIAALDGVGASDHPGRLLEELLPSQLVPMAGDLRAALETGDQGVRHELSLHRNGEPRYLDAAYYPVRSEQGTLLGVTAIVVDQTPQVRTRRRIEELAASEQRRSAELLTLLRANPNAMVVFGPDDRVRHASSAMAGLLGTTTAALAGMLVSELTERMVAVGLKDPEEFRARTRRLFADRTLAVTDDVELDGPRLRSFRRTSTPVLAPDGGYLGRLVVLVDVTAERELDRERSEFLTVASHELKTPLTPLSIGLQAVERRVARGEPVGSELISKARRQLSRLNSLIDDLLDFSRVGSGRLELQPRLMGLDVLCAEVVGDLAATSPNHLVVLRPGAARVRVRGDRLRLEQVLVNLIQNAVKYSPRGGRVEVGLAVERGEAVVSVRDEGIGIPPEDQGRLFERFFRAQNATSRQFAGLGIGLHVAREVVQRHGGRFEVESAPGRGSTFRFYLPVAEVPVGPRSVLFVDDGAEDLARVRKVLEGEGWQLERASLDVALEEVEGRRPLALVVDLASFGDGWKAAWARLRTAATWTTAFMAILPAGATLGDGTEPLLARPLAPEVLAGWLRERLGAHAAS